MRRRSSRKTEKESSFCYLWYLCNHERWYRYRSYRTGIRWRRQPYRTQLQPAVRTVCRRKRSSDQRNTVCRYFRKRCGSEGSVRSGQRRKTLRSTEIRAWISTLLALWYTTDLLCKRILVHQDDSGKRRSDPQQQHHQLDSGEHW